MNSEVTMVRIYLTEGEAQLKTLIKRLHDWEKLRGVIHQALIKPVHMVRWQAQVNQ